MSFAKISTIRLNVVQLTIPPLRDRGVDIATLCRHFTELHASNGNAISFTARSQHVLEQYGWPGNVREMSRPHHAFQCAVRR